MRRTHTSDLAFAVLAIGVLVLLASSEGDSVQPSKPKKPRKDIESSLDKLLPPFRARVILLLELMRADGFRPLVWETYRSPERAAELAAKGKGVALSQHELGAAVDIVDEKDLWDAPAFFEALHRHALALGLGRIKRRNPKTGELEDDPPHVQALDGKQDAKLRALATAELRAEYVRQRYAA